MKQFILSEITSKVCCTSCVPKWEEFQITLPKLLDDLGPRVSNEGDKISYQEKKGRYSLTVMRFLTRKLRLLELLDEKKVSQISDSITQGFFSDEFAVRLDKGATITENYKNRVGGGSCMCGECSEYTRLYEMNPDRFEQLVVTCKNNSARAIIATLDNGKKFKCHSYADNSACMSKLDAHASKEGWLDVPGEDMIVSDLKWVEGGFPYQDDFMIYNIQSDGNITIGTNPSFKKAGVSYQGDTDVQGGYLEESASYCCNCNCVIGGQEINIEDRLYCEGCVDDSFTVCTECNEYIYNDDTVMVEDGYYCGICSQDVGSYCEHCNELVFSENIQVIEDEEGDIEVCNHCYENVSFALIKEKILSADQ